MVTIDRIPEDLALIRDNIRYSGGTAHQIYEGKTFIYIAMGEKPTGGYSIHIDKLEYKDNKVKVLFTELSPKRGDMLTQVITYPEALIMLDGKWSVEFIRQ